VGGGGEIVVPRPSASASLTGRRQKLNSLMESKVLKNLCIIVQNGRKIEYLSSHIGRYNLYGTIRRLLWLNFA
jgi:hypothetical protein